MMRLASKQAKSCLTKRFLGSVGDDLGPLGLHRTRIVTFPAARSAALAKFSPARLGLRATDRGDARCEFVLSAYPSKSMALSTMSLFPSIEEVGFIEFR